MKRLQDHQKVFGLGLSRTGTSSLTAALRALGISAKHYPRDARTARQLMGGDYDLSIFQRYQAFTDITVAPFYAQFDKLLLDSRFILTVRDKDSWLRSIGKHIGAYKTGGDFAKFILTLVYGSLDFDRELFGLAYDRHVANVTEYFKDRPDQLLILNIVGGEGWGKLCPFLGVRSPGIPFPHRNRTKNGLQELARKLELVSGAVAEVIPAGAAHVLINDNKFGLEICPGRRAIPFLERDGLYFGKPSDDDTAISELTRLREAGAEFLVFTWVSFWWFDHYSKFFDHVRSNYRQVASNDMILVYRLAGS